jgi:hypothetical protein
MKTFKIRVTCGRGIVKVYIIVTDSARAATQQAETLFKDDFMLARNVWPWVTSVVI